MASSQDTADALTIQLLYNLGLLRQPSNAEVAARNGQKVELVARDILGSGEHNQVIADRNLGIRARTENWERRIQDATNIAEKRAEYLAQLCAACGVNPDHPLEQADIEKAIANIEAKNQQLSSEGTELKPGRYFVK